MARLEVSAFDDYTTAVERLSELSNDEMWAIMKPAAEFLAAKFKEKILTTFGHGSNYPMGRIQTLADSIVALPKVKGEDTDGPHYEIYPEGAHHKYHKRVKTVKVKKVFGHVSKSGTRSYKTKGGVKTVDAGEVGFILEYGSPARNIPASHWMERTVSENQDRIIDLIQEGFNEHCESLGL